MIQLTEEQLEKLHAVQLEMLLEVRRICETYHINYSLIGGTLLGAIRHRGYIPWDDDADVGMLREDYERFRKICDKELNHQKYYFQDDRNTEGYRWGYGKLRKKNTLFARENQGCLNFGQEIFIDIFPLDYAPDNMPGRILHMFYCFCIRKILWSPVGAKAAKHLPQKAVYNLLSRIPKNRVYAHYYGYIKRKKKSRTVRINLFPTRKPYGFPKQYFDELIEVSFEGEKFKGSRFYDSYLKIKYDNYLVLPPADQRKTHPVERIIF